jgi:hypothetical protein
MQLAAGQAGRSFEGVLERPNSNIKRPLVLQSLVSHRLLQPAAYRVATRSTGLRSEDVRSRLIS